MSRTRLRALPVLLALFVFACSTDEAGDGGAGARSTEEGSTEEGSTTEDPGSSTQPDVPISTMVADIETFWAEMAPGVGLAAYEPVDPNRIVAVSDLRDGFEAYCDDEPVEPEEAAGNAFVATCSEGILVVYDDVELFPDLRRLFGHVGPSTTLAHEWGHVIQAQVAGGQDDLTSLVAEQQADCYTGAYAAWAAANGLGPFDTESSLDAAVGATIESRDETGSSPDDPEAHGNGFDRVRAFQEGFDRGVGYCAGYVDLPLPITQMEFDSAEDEANEGNLPFDEALELLDESTADFFSGLAPDLEAPPLDIDQLESIYDQLGDNAVGFHLAMDRALAVQDALGEETEGEGGVLQRACLVGAWLHEDLTAGAESTLSPGDVDEALLALTQDRGVTSSPGLVFEAVASLRLGIIDGIDTCRLGG